MPPKFTRRADARPDELARAALELCAEQGVQATRVADVAERAGVTVGTIYRYFASKDELVDAALALARPPVRAHELADRPGAALPALAEAARRWGGFFDGDGARAVRVTLSEPRRLAPGSPGPVGAAIDEFTEILAAGAARGDLRTDLDTNAVARALVGALALGTALNESPARAVIDVVAAMATRGLRPDGISWKAS
jgi:AcrR family transcriptional regulator